MKFTLTVRRTQESSRLVEVEADNLEDAQTLAIEIAEEFHSDQWETLEMTALPEEDA